MKLKEHTPESILIIVALFAAAILIGYNAFYIPKPTIYQVQDTNSAQSATVTNSSLKSTSKIKNASVKININTATASDFDQNLTGIGPVIAERIVKYREQHGNFKTIDDIKNVKGIGDALFKKIKDNITVS
ncbi:MAG: helix-hairpin-helix domain-containing protein [Bacillota bacterium]|nr:helix-hairpin-helix domain-containing protein [Bacillota bacterium]